MATSWSTIVLEYVCPSIGAILSGLMFAAPIGDVRRALLLGSLGPLNPLPFSMMTGNCIGWCAYAYYTRDPFVLAANLPGLLISLWLDFGVSKIQYLDLYQGIKRGTGIHTGIHSTGSGLSTRLEQSPGDDQGDISIEAASTATASTLESLTMVPQEVAVLRVMVFWSLVLLYVGWFHPSHHSTAIVGIVVNVNLVFFYGAPLRTILEVIQKKCSDSIHVPTMMLNWVNTSFWLAYGFARRDYYIVIPNGCGLMLGLSQGLLSLLYPKSAHQGRLAIGNEQQEDQDDEPLEVKDDDDEASRDLLIV